MSVRDLPTVNAILNSLCAALLLAGWWCIRSERRRAHAAFMSAAVFTSVLFLACYLVYHFQVGSVRYQGEGPLRVVYFAILLSHTLLAVANVPLVLVTLTRALRERFVEHRRLARVTLPVWLYVSLTGVVVYLMLYRM